MAISKVFEGKTILFGMPKRYGIYKLVVKNLELMGFKVIDISFDDEVFNYKNSSEKIENFVRKTFLRDKNFKQELKFKHQKSEIDDRINSVHKADYALLIRPDLYPEKIIKTIKSKTDSLIGYQWDGLSVFPKVLDLIPLFDRFFVFDPKDIGIRGAEGISNFYFDDCIFEPSTQNHYDFDLYFIGTYIESRMDFIACFLEKCNESPFKILFEIYVNNMANIPENYRNLKNVNFFSEKVSFETVYQRGKNAKTLVDFVNLRHNGLSLRVFEALGTHKKLITTNAQIINYDLYNPKNILVYTEQTSSQEIIDFLATDYEMPPIHILKKYSFENWIKTIFVERN
ncbi:hypothetical protein [Soonwooa purpurea]